MAIAFTCLYVLLGLILIPCAGIESDEASFSVVMYGPLNPSYCIPLFHRSVPVMIYPYAGALKALLCWPIFHWIGPGAYSLRVPMVIAGALTILLFYKLAELMAGSRAALFAALLLATDASFLLTNTFDWGPVVLQHLLFVAGCLLIARGRPIAGCFLFGLALWNKAIFIWALSGLAAATAAAYLPAVRRAFANRRTIGLSVLSFVVGAAPLIGYNFRAPNATLQANVHLSLENFRTKVASLNGTLDGSILFGIIAAPETYGAPKVPSSIAGRISGWMRDRLGRIYSSAFSYAVLLACLSAPFWWRTSYRRAGVFAIVFLVVSFMTMAGVRYTGAAHHIVLLYPIPQLSVAIALAALPWGWLRVPALAVLILSNLLVVNQYLAELERNGAYRLFTDAYWPLSRTLSGFEGRRIYALDFGMEDNLNLTEKGRLDIRRAYPLKDLTESRMAEMVADRNALFVNHVPPVQYFPGVDEELVRIGESRGRHRRDIALISDSNGRPQFELYRFD